MKQYIKKKGFGLIAASVVLTMGAVSCSEDIDESNLYSFTGQTIEDYLASTDSLSAFNAILIRSGYSRNMSTYGQYTCFAPVNKGVDKYLSQLYNDEEAAEAGRPHNGITETAGFDDLDVLDKVQLLSDSLCLEISKYHLCPEIHRTIDVQSSNSSWMTMQDRVITVDYAGSSLALNGNSYVINGDNEMTNGYVHVCDSVLHLSNRLCSDELTRNEDFKIFGEALKMTGLDKAITKVSKGITYSMSDAERMDREKKNKLYYPKECKILYTVFAESDEVFAEKGIHSVQDLIEKCKEWYGGAAGWYDYLSETGNTVSTGTDYTNEFNVLHMFMAYHILGVGMPVDKIVYEYSATNSNWNFSFGYEPNDYFETMLPNTLLKCWELNPMTTKDLYINRYRKNNTLTDQIATFGSEEMHPIVFPGVKVDRTKSINCYNGYIHRINDVLLYDENARNALNERMRFDSSTFLGELINNNIRGATVGEITVRNSGGDGNRVAFPLNFFDNIVCYNNSTVLRFCVQGEWRAHESDQMQGWDQYDFAVKLPHVPTGEYEIRVFYPPMPKGGLMQFYLGNSPAVSSMKALGLPFDARADAMEDKSIGWTDPATEDDYGVQTDADMHLRGYMRGPSSFSRGQRNSIKNKLIYDASDPYSAASQMTGSTSCRTESGYGTMMVRHIVATTRMEQSKDYWLRIKNLITDDKELGWSFDFIEIVPVSVVNSQIMSEDWY